MLIQIYFLVDNNPVRNKLSGELRSMTWAFGAGAGKQIVSTYLYM